MIRSALSLLLASGLVAGLAACTGNSSLGPVVSSCSPDQGPVELSGELSAAAAKTYLLLPFEVMAGTGRVEVGYSWADSGSGGTPLTQTVFDLGLWDEAGYRSPAGFRGWSGSRQGRIDAGQEPVFVQADTAERGYVPGAIKPGLWHVELGVAAVAPDGANWRVRIQCKRASPGAVPIDDPVDRAHVADAAAGWYHADFHMHGYHSNPDAPSWADFVAQAREAELDVLVVTEYVTGQHWRRLGAVQRSNPDLLIWPGREIITYFGHANTFGETYDVLEYRHGLEDVRLADIQAAAKASGALFQVNHPQTFRGALFENFCRGCGFELDDELDWDRVDTIEVHNGPVLVTGSELGVGAVPGQTENPFTQPAIDLWEAKLNAGFRITATSGSDSKGVDAPADRPRKGYGSSATAIFADNLSRDAVSAALRAGRAYIKTRGARFSPHVEMTASDGAATVMFGGSLAAESAKLRVEVRGGANQTLRLIANGDVVLLVPIPADEFSQDFPIQRVALTEGPLGTFWRVDIADEQALTIIGNPIFLTGAP